jgi:hypothetical protein
MKVDCFSLGDGVFFDHEGCAHCCFAVGVKFAGSEVGCNGSFADCAGAHQDEFDARYFFVLDCRHINNINASF